MVFLTVILIGIGLSTDTFAIAVTSGRIFRTFHLRNAFRLALFFGVAQALMPFFGYLAGVGLKSYIAEWDHWVSFGFLAIVGGKMVFESLKTNQNGENGFDPTRLAIVFTIALATSIDTLVVGITLPLIAMPILLSVSIIGVTTFCIALAGVYVGVRAGHFFERRIETIGGIILILIGLKILVEHLTTS